MIVYLYALVDRLDDVAGLTGIAGEPLTLLTVQDLSVVAGLMAGPPPIDREQLVAQDDLVRQLHARAGSMLPMRFGASFTSVAEAERGIRTLSSGLKERLTRARGREQMTIRVLRAAGPTPTSGASASASAAADDWGASGVTSGSAAAKVGTAYLAARAARASPPEVAPILEALEALQRATRVQAGQRPGIVATIYHLIDRGAAEDYRRVAERAAQTLEGYTVRITGPSPCYAFS